MKYIKATFDMANEIYNVLHTTIKAIYPKYYPKEVVDFFCKLHSNEHILEGIVSGNMGVLVYDNVIVGTGRLAGNHITGVYVLPSYQNRGADRILWSAWKWKLQKNMIWLFWNLCFQRRVYMSIEAIKQWDMGYANWKMM